MQCYDATEQRARELCERSGVPWERANFAAWMALAAQQEAEEHEHEPADWQLVCAAVAIACGLGLGLWLWFGGGS